MAEHVSSCMHVKTLLFILLAGVLYAGQGKPPETPAAIVFTRWLEAFNRADPAGYKQFLETYSPGRLPYLDQELEFRAMTGGFHPVSIESPTPTTLTGVVKEREGTNQARLDLEVEPEAPHRIVKLGLRVIERARPPVARMSEDEAVAALKTELREAGDSGRFSGAVAVARNGSILFSDASGLADREQGKPNESETRFRIGSMNKMFTGVAVLHLAQAGKLQLDDLLGKHLPDYPNQEVASRVTIHHLLTHTGGTGDIFGFEFTKHRLQLKDLKDYVALYGSRGLAFEPGEKHVYSNYGYLLLGVLIEKVSGMSYYDYVREHVFKPAGMTQTDSLPEEQHVPERSTGYMRRGKDWKPNTDTLPYRGTSAGGGYSTVGDLVRFANALMNHKLLNPEYTKLLTTGKVNAVPGAKYAYGFLDVNRDVRSIGHGGGAPGMNGDLRIFPASGYVVAVLANQDPPAAQQICDFIADRLPQK